MLSAFSRLQGKDNVVIQPDFVLGSPVAKGCVRFIDIKKRRQLSNADAIFAAEQGKLQITRGKMTLKGYINKDFRGDVLCQMDRMEAFG